MYVIKRKRRWRRRRIVRPAMLFLCAGLLLLFGVVEKSGQSPRAARILRTVPESYPYAEYTVPVSRQSLSERKVYPYSVIRGGVRDRDDLISEIKADPVVASHYEDFRADEARIVRVKDEKLVHVSYRVDDKIFWTAKQIRLPQGEALITDGLNLARTRCGNRISVEARQPTSEVEPSAEVLLSPVVPPEPDSYVAETITSEPMYLSEEIRNPLDDLVNPPDLLTLEDRFFYEEFLPYRPGEKLIPEYFVEPHDFPEVPEPGTLLLLGTGVTAGLLLRRFRSRK
jgi:PEP-CTERM motif